MTTAVVAITGVALIAIVVGVTCLLFARWVALTERWIVALPVRVFRRGWLPGPPSRRDILVERILGAVLIVLGISVLSQFPVQFAEVPRTVPLTGGEMRKLIAKHAEPIVTRGQAVGVAVGIIDGSKSATAGFGRVKIGDHRTPDADTIFEIGSMTKVFTACALSAMVRRKQVRLDEAVDSLLPRSFRVPSYGERHITLVDLASHTSGLPRIASSSQGLSDIISLSFIKNPYAACTEKDLREFLARHTLASEPGERYEYSNLGYGLLGYVLCLKQHRSYEKMIDDEICQPLGLKDTSISLSRDSATRLAQGYYGVETDGTNIMAFPASVWEFNDTNAGAGALRSTVNDLMKFVRSNMGHAPAGMVSTLRATHSARYRIDDRMSVCLGWHTLSTPKHKDPIIWHNGGTGGHSSFVGFCTKHRTGVVLLCNVSPSDESTDSAALKMLYAVCDKSEH